MSSGWSLRFQNPGNFVYKYLYPIFGEFIGDEQVKKLKKHGYYAIGFAKFNVKMIHVNTQFKDIFNTDLMINNTNRLNFFDVIGD